MDIKNIKKQISELQNQEKLYEEEYRIKQQNYLNERVNFFQKIKQNDDVNFMISILQDKSSVGTARYGWQEYYALCDNPNLTSPIIDLLLQTSGRRAPQIISILLTNHSLSFELIKKILKYRYFSELEDHHRRLMSK